MVETHPLCPICGESEHTYKVSQIYIEAAAQLNRKPLPGKNILSELISLPEGEKVGAGLLKIQKLRSITRDFGPPSGGTQIVRSVHPDMIVGAFSLLVIYFLYQVYNTQPGYLLPIVIILVLFYAGYFFTRNTILEKFADTKNQAEREKKKIEEAVGKWMRVYYCVDDNIVFDPEKKDSALLEQMEAYLYR